MRKMIIVLEGGLIQDIRGIPDETEIEIRDFDIEGIEPELLSATGDGEEYVKTVWRKTQ